MPIPFARRYAAALLVAALAAITARERTLTGFDAHEEFHTLEVVDLVEAGQPVVATWVTGQGWTRFATSGPRAPRPASSLVLWDIEHPADATGLIDLTVAP